MTASINKLSPSTQPYLSASLLFVLLAVSALQTACEAPTFSFTSDSSSLRVETSPEPTSRSANALTTELVDIPGGSWAPYRISLLNIGDSVINVTELCLTTAEGTCQSFTTDPAVTFKLCGGGDDSPASCSEAMLPVSLAASEAVTFTVLFTPQTGVARNENTSLIITSDDEITRFIINLEASSCMTAMDGGCVAEDDLDGDGVLDSEDNCMELANMDQADADGDGRGDLCDDSPNTSNYLLRKGSISQGAEVQESMFYRVQGDITSGAHQADSAYYRVQGRLEF